LQLLYFGFVLKNFFQSIERKYNNKKFINTIHNFNKKKMSIIGKNVQIFQNTLKTSDK